MIVIVDQHIMALDITVDYSERVHVLKHQGRIASDFELQVCA